MVVDVPRGMQNVPTAIMLTMTTGSSLLLFISRPTALTQSSFMTSVEEAYMPQAPYSVVGSADSDPTEYTDVIMPLSGA